MPGLVPAVAAATIVILTTTGAAAASTSYFETPSKNIVCGYSAGSGFKTELECGVVSGLVPPAPRPAGGCHGIDPASNRLELSTTGRPAGFCSGDAGVFAKQGLAPVLAYGKAWHEGGYTCTSATTGLTCKNGAGHGFFLSRASWHSL